MITKYLCKGDFYIVATWASSSVCGEREINPVRNDYIQMNLIYFTHNYMCLWLEEIKQFTRAPHLLLQDSRRISRALVYNAIHVGYFEGDLLMGYHGDTTDTNKQKPRRKTKM